MNCPTCHQRIWREDGKCRPCSLAAGHTELESMHTIAVRTRLLATEEDLVPLRTQIPWANIIHDSVIVEVPVVEGAADAMRLGGEAVAMSAPFPLTGREFREHVHNDPFPGVDLEWFTGRARGALCPSCERANCLIGRAERQRVARLRRSARNVMFGGFGGAMFGGAMFGNARQSGKSHIMFEAMRNLPDTTVIHFDTEAVDMGVRWHTAMELSMVAAPADPARGLVVHKATEPTDRIRGLTRNMVMYDDFQVFDSVPTTPRPPKPSPVPPHITKGLADAVTALPRSRK